MCNTPSGTNALLLRGLDGSNPLAFLATLGTLRALTLATASQQIKLSWTQQAGAYRPVLHPSQVLDERDLVDLLDGWLKKMDNHLAFSLADNLSVSRKEYRRHAQECVDVAHIRCGDRIAADFAASFACDALLNQQGRVQDTALRTMSGAGHQHFLKSMRQIISRTTAGHIRKALFAPWTYEDPVANQTLRWDPADDSRYALQWRDPSGDPSRKKRGGMLGANRLAIEGLPLMPCAPVGGRLATTGFIGQGSQDTLWTWPIWSCPITLDICRSLLAQPIQIEGDAKNNNQFRARGIIAAFRSRRITVGNFRNFTPATAIF